MKEAIVFAISNYSLSFFVLGLLWSAILILKHRSDLNRAVADDLLSGFLLFAIGITFLYNFVMHVFFGDMSARFIGWANSPFQLEVGYASLGFGIVGVCAHRSTFHFRLAALLGPAFFLWGAAVGHIYQLFATHNLAPGNAGIILWTDILIPVVGFVFLFLAYRRTSPRPAPK